MNKNVIIEKRNNYKLIHNVPVMSTEEKEQKKKEILTNIVNCLSNNKNNLI